MSTNFSNEDLDRIKAALKAEGRPEHSAYLLMRPDEPKAKCPACDVWFAINEIKTANGCPKCHQQHEFEVPDEYAGCFAP